MISLLTNEIYCVDPSDKSLGVRFNDAQVDFTYKDIAVEDLYLPQRMTGLKKHDLLIFGEVADSTGITPFNRIVVSSGIKYGVVASEGAVLDFSDYQTPELAKKFATLSQDEIISVGLESLALVLERKFKGIRGFSR